MHLYTQLYQRLYQRLYTILYARIARVLQALPLRKISHLLLQT